MYKGIDSTLDRTGIPLAIHGVQHVFHDPVWLDEWPDENHQTKLVFITKGIEREPLKCFSTRGSVHQRVADNEGCEYAVVRTNLIQVQLSHLSLKIETLALRSAVLSIRQ